MTAPTSSATAFRAAALEAEWSLGLCEVIVGKDVLELLSSAMYVDPITVYREYVQNAADAVDEARRTGLLRGDQPGRVDIAIDPVARLVRVRDNGAGLCQSLFAERLTALGASRKRGSSARGFRGVGRLAGLAYCQELVFRSRALGELEVSELRWDCRKLKASLRSADSGVGLSDLVRDVVSVRRVPAPDNPAHFFEVELKGIVRHRNDRLLNPKAVADYLAQVAPVPFSPEFRLGSDITAALRPYVALGDLDIRISGIAEPVFRPHRDWLEIADDKFDRFTDVEILDIPGIDGGVGAVVWVLHHSYAGAIPAGALVKGLRLRSGNIQIGDHMLLEELFAEARFNSWAVGEVHVVEKRIIPNGRRDHFEQSVHVDNLLNHVAPVARDVASRCRRGSVRRRWLRDFDLHAAAAREKIEIIAQGGLGESDRGALVQAARRALSTMEKITVMPEVADDSECALHPTLIELRGKLASVVDGGDANAYPLASLPAERKAMYEHLFALIYECSTNRVAAKALVDRILLKIT